MVLFVAAVLVVLFLLLLKVAAFNRTAYHSATGNSYFYTMSDKGRYGEYQIFRALKHLEKQDAKFLFNVYLPKENGETTECDVILITSRGFIVFESKNYSGWIFGDEKQKTWTQTLPQGKGKPARKETFFNPIMQNSLHIKCLKAAVGTDYAMQSVIAFSERCTLKKVSVYSPDVQVVKRNDVESAVKNALQRMPESAVSKEQIQQLYDFLYPFSQVSETIKQKHMQAVKEHDKKEG